MKKVAVFLSTSVLLTVLYAATVAADESAIPLWYLEEIATLTAGSGRWVTDNSAYMSEQEPYEFYATEWVSSFGGTSMRGRLFGIRDGRETGSFWEFRQYWHPLRKEVVVEQFGTGGTVGLGTMWREDGTTKSLQTFSTADGKSSQTGHVSSFPDSKTHVTDSFDVNDGEWLPRRHYVWQPEGRENAGN